MQESHALVLAVLLLAVSYPAVEGATVPLGAGEEISVDFEISTATHIDYVVRSHGAPVGVALLCDGAVVAQDISVGQASRSLRLEPGDYSLVISANDSAGTELEYRINIDPEVLGGLTAKNVLVLSIAAALGVVAVIARSIRKR